LGSVIYIIKKQRSNYLKSSEMTNHHRLSLNS